MAAETPREITHETIKGMYCFFSYRVSVRVRVVAGSARG